MRAVIAAIALVFTFGLALPTPADARAPVVKRVWGCTFSAHPGFLVERNVHGPDLWFAAGTFGWCTPRARVLIITTRVWQRVKGAPNILVAEYGGEDFRIGRDGMRDGRKYWSLSAGWLSCPYAPPVDGAPFVMRMTAERKFHPDQIHVRTRDFTVNPCSAPSG